MSDQEKILKAERDRKRPSTPEEEREQKQRRERKIEEKVSLGAPSIYKVIEKEGVEELERPAVSLWWSGVAAGIAISMSVVSEAFLHHYLPDAPWRPLVENFGYCIGFIIVIHGRMQLFTEHTITVILPLVTKFSRKLLWATTRLWGIVLAANLVGTFLAALAIYHGNIMIPEFVEASMALSHHFAEKTPMEALLHGIPAGFLIAALVWCMPNTGSKLPMIILLTYLIALGEFAHVVAGSTEVFLLLIAGEINIASAVFGLILPALIGNIIGGSGLFTMLAYGQIQEEIEKEDDGEEIVELEEDIEEAEKEL